MKDGLLPSAFFSLGFLGVWPSKGAHGIELQMDGCTRSWGSRHSTRMWGIAEKGKENAWHWSVWARPIKLLWSKCKSVIFQQTLRVWWKCTWWALALSEVCISWVGVETTASSLHPYILESWNWLVLALQSPLHSTQTLYNKPIHLSFLYQPWQGSSLNDWWSTTVPKKNSSIVHDHCGACDSSYTIAKTHLAISSLPFLHMIPKIEFYRIILFFAVWNNWNRTGGVQKNQSLEKNNKAPNECQGIY